MNPSRIFILRPIATMLVMIAILLSGLLAYRLLPTSALPQVDYPVIQVVSMYPGAGAEVMAMTVTAPLERQFGAMSGLTNMSSGSAGGVSVITLQFSLKVSLDVAVQSVQAAINAASGFLPPGMPSPPTFNKVNPADAPIITLAVTSETLALPKIRDLVETRLAQKLSQVSGVGLVNVGGGQRPAVRIQANQGALASYGLGLDAIRLAIAGANSNQPKGNIDGPLLAYEIEANSQLRSAEEYQDLVIANVNNLPVRLSDVATVTEAEEDKLLAAWSGEQKAILVNVQRQPGANVIEVVDRIRALIPELKTAMPVDIEVDILTDRTRTIRSSVADVQFELMLAIALVVMVIFLFLRSASATVIPSLAVPLSIVGTFGVMYLAGFSINNLTLMALTIATGFVVDDAIVMIENIARHIEDGESPMQAALNGSRQIGFTIISLTFSLLAVLIPLLFMSDVVGRLFREFAITLAVSILISAVVSLSLTPMLCARLLKPHRKQAQTDFLDKVITRYAAGLQWALARQPLILGIAAGSLILTIALAYVIPKGFFPTQDTGVIQGITEITPSASFQVISQRQQLMVGHLLQDPAVASISSVVGIDGINSTLNSGRLIINLKPWGERTETAEQVVHRIRREVAGMEGIRLHLQPVQDLTLDTSANRTQYQYMVTSTSDEALHHYLPRLIAKLQGLKEIRDVASVAQQKGLRASVLVDRDNASRLGVSMAAVDNAIYNAFGQRIVSTIFTQSNQYRVILEASQAAEQGVSALANIYIPSDSGRQIPLSAIARFTETAGPLLINRQNQLPAAAIAFNLNEGYALGHAVNAIETARASLDLPVNILTRFQGAANAFRAALANELFLVLAALATIYIVLGVLYESYIHPLTILSTLPSAGVGALLALSITGSDLGVIAIIGIVLLIGIVQKNAIMMIDFALEAERVQGKAPEEAIYQACLLRFRPILMTTLASLLSAVPLVIGSGPGSELREPLGIAMIGGLICSQLLTLFTTPVIYLAFDRLARQLKKPALTTAINQSAVSQP